MIVDIAVTTGETNEGAELVPAVERIEALTGTHVATATADAGYAYAKVYGALERRRTDAVMSGVIFGPQFRVASANPTLPKIVDGHLAVSYTTPRDTTRVHRATA